MFLKKIKSEVILPNSIFTALTFSLAVESRVSDFDFLHSLLHYHPSDMFSLTQFLDLLATALKNSSSQELNCLIHMCRVRIMVKF